MEELFFKHIKNDDLEKAMNVYENNHVDVMFMDNCVIKHLLQTKKLESIKWLITLDDFHEFSIDEPPGHFISIMTLACKHCYYDLIKYLHDKFYNLTWMDINDLLSNTKDTTLVRDVVTNFVNEENFAHESVLCVKSDEVLTVLLERGYKILEDILGMTDNDIIIYRAHKDGIITPEVAEKIIIHNYEYNNINIVKFMVDEYKVNIDENNDRFTKNLFYDPIDCFKYVFKDPTTLSEGTLKTIMNDAMSHRAHKIASFVYHATKVLPDEGCHSDVYDDIEYTKLVSKMLNIAFKPNHLMCSNTQTFKYILKRINIDESNINRCLTVVFMNENSDHVRMFLKQIPEKLMKKEVIADVFVLCCLYCFIDLAKEIWLKYKVNISKCTINKGRVLNTADDEVINDFPINTPKRLVKSLLGEDGMLNVLTWVTEIFNVSLKYSHVTQCLEEMYGNNPKILLHVLRNNTLNEQQLKNVFINVIINYENDSYYICKYLSHTYGEYMTDELKEILYKYSLSYTQKAYELFETPNKPGSNAMKYFRQSVYGNNTHTFEHLSDKFPEFLKSKAKMNELFRYACSCDSMDIVRLFCSRFERYEYKMDDDTIVPIVKDTIEYYIYNNQYNKIVNILKKSKESFKNEDCNVCYEKANVKTDCSHYYCVTCITKWYTRNKNCPMCKRRLNIKKCKHDPEA